MNRVHTVFLWSLCAVLNISAATNFVNFETAPVHPIALSPSGDNLAVCNTPDGRIELFQVTPGGLRHRSSIPVGIDPVTARFRNDSELWVVNQISDSINVVDLAEQTVVRVISTRDAPVDVVFAGEPRRAFVSCPPENLVQVFDPETGALQRIIEIGAERPRAMSVSADGKKVFVAILESGNGTTILAPRFTGLTQFPAGGPVDLFIGPYGGQNPPPNSGVDFSPLISTNLPASSPPPRVSLIVKKQTDGHWIDDNGGNWTEFVSGTNAAFSGRVQGWDLWDRDVAVIDAVGFSVSYLEGLMNICLDLVAHPASNQLAVIGTEALNHLRFEPVLQSVFTRAQLALADFSESNQTRVLDLNPHLDYQERKLPFEERQKSIGDPRGVVWNADGSRLYVAGMGSDNLVMLNPAGERLLDPVPLPAGPVGIAFDERHNRLYVANRFAASITVLDADNLRVIENVSFFDPTPDEIRKGRPHFYNTHKSSGLGQAACASCHVDGRFDRLAWDLGSQLASIKPITSTDHNFGAFPPASTNHFHPMKGPMVTQTLQDIIGHEPFHWRGDRNGLEEFNPTFTELQGADEELTDAEMQEFEDFLATIHFPPNRFRGFDNSLPRDLQLQAHALGRGERAKGELLPNGDAMQGLNLFRTTSCNQCHSLPSGTGADRVFRNGRWNSIPPGPNGERHVALSAIERSDELPLKIPHLRNLSERLGFNANAASVAGFGFTHDGRVDSLTRFLQDGFGLINDKQTADVIAFLLAFSGSDLPTAAPPGDPNVAPGNFSRDVPAATGRQLLLTADSAELSNFITRANVSTGRVDLVVKARLQGINRGWLYDPSSRTFQPDAAGPTVSRTQLFSDLALDGPLLFTLVPKGTGRRIAIDRDADDHFDFDELQAGTNPADPASFPGADGVRLAATAVANRQVLLVWPSEKIQRYHLLTKTALSQPAWTVIETNIATTALTTNALPINPAAPQQYFTVEILP